MKFTVYDALDGRVLYAGDSDRPDLLALGGQAVLEGQAHEDGWIEDGAHCPMPARPGPHHTFDWAAKQWLDPRTLADLRTAKWDEIKRAREAAFTAPLVTPFGVFDADAAGQDNITRAVLLANNLTSLGHPVAIEFTLYDNSVRVLDAPAMVQVGLLLGGRVQLIRARATALRGLIETALSAEEVAVIAWA